MPLPLTRGGPSATGKRRAPNALLAGSFPNQRSSSPGSARSPHDVRPAGPAQSQPEPADHDLGLRGQFGHRVVGGGPHEDVLAADAEVHGVVDADPRAADEDDVVDAGDPPGRAAAAPTVRDP